MVGRNNPARTEQDTVADILAAVETCQRVPSAGNLNRLLAAVYADADLAVDELRTRRADPWMRVIGASILVVAMVALHTAVTGDSWVYWAVAGVCALACWPALRWGLLQKARHRKLIARFENNRDRSAVTGGDIPEDVVLKAAARVHELYADNRQPQPLKSVEVAIVAAAVGALAAAVVANRWHIWVTAGVCLAPGWLAFKGLLGKQRPG